MQARFRKGGGGILQPHIALHHRIGGGAADGDIGADLSGDFGDLGDKGLDQRQVGDGGIHLAVQAGRAERVLNLQVGL